MHKEIKMELSLYQKQLIDTMRLGRKLWMDDLGKTTYHIKMKKSVKSITEQTISSLIWHGLIKMNGSEFILTDLGMNCEIFSTDKNNNRIV